MTELLLIKDFTVLVIVRCWAFWDRYSL